jgi:MATE family multidrug resistance protein
MVSLAAEPLTALVDTSFVARLGPAPLAALGVATTLLSSVLWVFNSLSIGTQTELARAHGGGEEEQGRRIASLALGLGALRSSIAERATLPSVILSGKRPRRDVLTRTCHPEEPHSSSVRRGI